MKRFCNSLPKDRLLDSSNDFIDALYENDRDRRTYTVQTTGAKLTFNSALVVLAHYASSLVRVLFPLFFRSNTNYYYSNMKRRFLPQFIITTGSPKTLLSVKLFFRRSHQYEALLESRHQKNFLPNNPLPSKLAYCSESMDYLTTILCRHITNGYLP